ncbi:MAG: plasmid replication initiator TrfA, partial [Halothiobacillaceae bacterium]
MKKSDNLLDRIHEMQARAKQRAERAPLPDAPLPKNNVVRLPLWPEPVRAVPNGFLRSALFGVIAKGKRRYIDGEQIAALEGIEISYTGQRLDQGDLDVWESVLHAVRTQDLGSRCRVTSYALLKLMGRTDTGKNRATLNKRITRLVA